MPNLLVSATTRYDPKGLNQAKKHISAFDKTVKNLGKTFAGVFAARKILQFGKTSVNAFAADDKAAKVLAKSLDNLGMSYANPQIKDFISTLERQFGVLDDQLRPAFQKLVTTTGNLSQSQDLLKTALDLSAFSGSDVVSVAADLSKAYAGNTRGLIKYGLGLSKSQLAAMSFEDILKQVAKVSGGQAKIAADSYAGSLDKLTVASKNASESLGKDLIDALTILGGSGGLPKTLSIIESIASAIGTAIIGFSRFIRILDIVTGSGAFNMVGDLNKANAEFLAQDKARAAYKFAGTGMASSYNSKVAADNKLKKAKADELAMLNAKNKATKEEAQMKKEQAALDKLKEKFDLERIGLNVALNQATDEETKARIRAQIAILDETGKTAQAANDALVKAQADKLNQEVKAATALAYLAFSAGSASTSLLNMVGRIPGVTFNPSQQPDRNYVPATNIPAAMPDGTPTLIPGRDYNPSQQPDRNVDQKAGISIVVNTGPSMADENTIVDAVQAALNEIARRGYLTTYAGALPA